MLIKALELNFKANPQPRMAGHVCVGMSKHSVCKTTTVQHALPLHGWTKTRRLRAVTVSLDRHCSLCQIYLLNHGNCGHCFRHIHCRAHAPEPIQCDMPRHVRAHPHVASVNNNN